MTLETVDLVLIVLGAVLQVLGTSFARARRGGDDA